MLIQKKSEKLNVKLRIIGWVCSKTVLVSHNVICFGYFMPMSHGVNNKSPTTAFPHLSP